MQHDENTQEKKQRRRGDSKVVPLLHLQYVHLLGVQLL
jgi:hypothetical protein